MNVFSTATNIGQAFKNAGRVREILTVFVSHGFADLIHRMRLSRFLTSRQARKSVYENIPVSVRLRSAFEELGPTFVKLGQLLASRPDLIPQNFVDEFSKLQDKVGFVPFPEMKRFIEAELTRPLGEVFSEFEETPMAAASIAQVHGAVLKTGERVAVKVQRPGIERLIQNDVSILRGLALLLERYVPESRPMNPSGLVEEFFRSILYELDFFVEANNIKRIRANLARLTKVTAPIVYSEFSNRRILVLERFEGIRFSDREAILAAGIEPMDIVNAGADAFFHMVMHDGLFHADLHGGNLFVLSDGRIGFIDFGIVGRLSRRVQDSVITMFIAIVGEDYETLAAEYLDLCYPIGPTDLGMLQKDLMDTISPYVGMSLGDVNIGQILLRSTSTAVKHNLRVPRELMLLFKAILTIESLGKKLEPGFDILQVGHRLARQVLTVRYSRERIFHDLMVTGREVQSLAESMPRLLKRFLKTWSKQDFAFEIRNADTASLASAVQEFTRWFVLGLLSMGLFALGIALLFLDKDPKVPVWGFSSCLIATSFLGYALWSLRTKKKA